LAIFSEHFQVPDYLRRAKGSNINQI
jgi:hypothetical protein